jgi:hypothetical protein
LISAIILLVSASSVSAGYVYSINTEIANNWEKEADNLRDKISAIESSNNEINQFENLQLTISSELIAETRVLINEVHIRTSLNQTGAEEYSEGDYQTDLFRIAEALKRTTAELSLTGVYDFFIKFTLDDVVSSYIISTQDFTYSIPRTSWEQNQSLIFNQTTIGDFLTKLYSNWETTIKTALIQSYQGLDFSSLVTISLVTENGTICTNNPLITGTGIVATNNPSCNGIFIEYIEIFYFLKLLEDDLIDSRKQMSEKTIEIRNKRAFTDRLGNLVTLTTVATILTTYIATRLDNRESKKQLDELKSLIKNETLPEKEPRDKLGVIILGLALIIAVISYFFAFWTG